jgi:hypothetical protein
MNGLFAFMTWPGRHPWPRAFAGERSRLSPGAVTSIGFFGAVFA